MKFFLLSCAVVPVIFFGCSKIETIDIPAVKGFDIRRYCGKWYEIARLPNWFERGMSNVTASYSLRSDGTVKVVNSGWKNGKIHSTSGVARLAAASGTGELEVSFQWPFWSSYRVIRLNKDYSIAVVCGKSFDYLWILARKPELQADELAAIIEFLRFRGFPVEKLEFSGNKKGSTDYDTAVK